jgi:hypothetical protein
MAKEGHKIPKKQFVKKILQINLLRVNERKSTALLFMDILLSISLHLIVNRAFT